MVPLLSTSQLHALEVTERVASVLSLLAAVAIILTFVCSSKFRKPVNRLIFYASWGNLFANVATLISRSGVRAGPSSALCQVQAFLIQMFFIADALWNLAMAINTYLSVLKNYNAQQLKAMEWRYHLLCYGTPFIIALIFCFVDTQGRGRIYGSAQLWCIKIVRNREELRTLRQPSHPSTNETFPAYKTTEIDVISEVAGFSLPIPPPNCFDPEASHRHPTVSSKDYEPYSTTISSSPRKSDSNPCPRHSTSETPASRRSRAAREDNKAAIKYTKVALLFFTSLCVTWIPSSINRIYDLAHPNDVSYALNFISAIVLPLMGFWNGVIYFATSRAVCAGILRDLMDRWVQKKRSARVIRGNHSRRPNRAGAAESSMTERLMPTKKDAYRSIADRISGSVRLPKDEQRF
ncbi:MAG: hypothetical protein Q9168_001619 [Polycauliona sp. 1 TL-2023]